MHKSLSLYKEKRFTRLGYQSGAVYDCIPYLRKLLDETPLNNLLVRACKVYLENEFVLSGLKCLAIFTYKITMPFLNMVEKSDQNKLCELLPQLFDDLSSKNLDSLPQFLVPWKHVQIQETNNLSSLDDLILGEMCLRAAKGVELQCKREYWADPTDETKQRATRLNLLTEEQRSMLPTNNLNTERSLAKFGYLAAQSAAHSNKLFKAKRIRDDLVLSDQKVEEHQDLTALKVMKQLDAMEFDWSKDQKAKKVEHLKEALLKKKRHNEFSDQVLKKCKSHNGPVTSASELKELLKANPSNTKQLLRLEIQFQRCMHPNDVAARPLLYKVNKLSEQQMVENLTILLSGDSEAEEGVVFPCEDEIYEILKGDIVDNTAVEESNTEDNFPAYEFERPLIIAWEDAPNKFQWYVGFHMAENSDGTLRIDHLKRLTSTSDRDWIRPRRSDIQDVHRDQIVCDQFTAKWNFEGSRELFVIANFEAIRGKFDEMY